MFVKENPDSKKRCEEIVHVRSFVVVIVSTISTDLKTKITCLSTPFNIHKHVLDVMDSGHFDTLDLLESCELKKMVSVVNRF